MTTATAGTTTFKKRIYIYFRMPQLCKCVQYAYWSKKLLRFNMHRRRLISKENTEN